LDENGQLDYGQSVIGSRYHDTVGKDVENWTKRIVHILHYSDGKRDLITVSDTLGEPVWKLAPALEKLVEANLLTLEKSE